MPIVWGRPLRSAARAVALAKSSRRDNRPCPSLTAIDAPAADAWCFIESNSRRIPLPALKAAAARFQTPAGDGVDSRLAGIIGAPSLGIRYSPAVVLTQKGRCDAEPADHEMQAVRQGKEGPIESRLLAKVADFRDEFRRRQRRPACERRHLKDGTAGNGTRRHRADHIFDRSIQIAFREKPVIEEPKARRAENRVTMVQKGDDPGRKSFQPGAISGRVGVFDKLLGRAPPRIIIGEKDCLAHLAYRSRDWIDPVGADDLRPKLVPNFVALFPNVARRVRTRWPTRCGHVAHNGLNFRRNFAHSIFDGSMLPLSK